MVTESEYYSHEQLAVKLAMPVKTIRKLSYLRRLPGRVQIGLRCVRYNRMAIERALNSGSLLLATSSK
jgi:predicted DNA-binding transcriptional regulator AlpA